MVLVLHALKQFDEAVLRRVITPSFDVLQHPLGALAVAFTGLRHEMLKVVVGVQGLVDEDSGQSI